MKIIKLIAGDEIFKTYYYKNDKTNHKISNSYRRSTTIESYKSIRAINSWVENKVI